MASKGYVISVATDSRLFEQGVRMGIIKPVEDADDALTDLGKNRGPAQLEDDLKDAQRATDKLGDEARQNAKQMQSDYRKTGRAARDAADESGDGWTRSARKAGEGLDTIKEESHATAREAAASFDGSAQSIGDAFQEVAANAFAGFGPAGALAGIAAAAGIGLISTAFQNAGDDEEALKQKVSDLATEFIETGTIGQASIEHLADRLKTLATVTDGSEQNLSELRKVADDSGNSFKDLAQAYAGNTDRLKELWHEGQKKLAQIREEQQANNTNSVMEKGLAQRLADKATAQQKYNDYLGQSLGVARQAATEAENYAKAGGAEMERKAELISNVNDAYDEAAGAVDGYVDAESGVFDTDKYIAAMEAKQQELRDYQKNLASFSGAAGPEATAYLESLGTEQAATLLGAYKNASTTQQQELATIWAEAGRQNSASYTTNLKAGIPSTLQGPTITVDADTSRYDAAVRNINGHVYRAYVDFAPRNGSRVY